MCRFDVKPKQLFVCLFGFYIKAAHLGHILMSHMGKAESPLSWGLLLALAQTLRYKESPLVAFYDMPGRQWTYSRNPLSTGSPLLDRLLHHAGDTVGLFLPRCLHRVLVLVKLRPKWCVATYESADITFTQPPGSSLPPSRVAPHGKQVAPN